jgi:hypothetical protein
MKKETIIYLVIAAVVITGYFIYKDVNKKVIIPIGANIDINEVILNDLTKPIEGIKGTAKLVDQMRKRSDYNVLQSLQVKIKNAFNNTKIFTLHSKEYYSKIITDVQYILDNRKPI